MPVFIGHAEAVHCEFHKPITPAAARDALRTMRGVTVLDHRRDGGYVTPAEAAGEDTVYIQPRPHRSNGD